MAKPKVKVLVIHDDVLISVYVDDLRGNLSDVLSVEGVQTAGIFAGTYRLSPTGAMTSKK